jgi:hypothetical protein
MSQAIATREAVAAAMDQLTAENRPVTAGAVQAHLGGGSKPTILQHLRAIRAEQTATAGAANTLPASVLDAAMPGLLKLFEAGRAEANAASARQQDRLLRCLADLEDELAGQVEAEEKLTARIVELEDQSKAEAERIERSTGELASTRRQLEQTQQRLAEAEAQMRVLEERCHALTTRSYDADEIVSRVTAALKASDPRSAGAGPASAAAAPLHPQVPRPASPMHKLPQTPAQNRGE